MTESFTSFFEGSRARFAARFALPSSIVAVSFAAIFIRFSGANPIAIAFHRMSFSALIIFPFVFLNLQELKNISKRQWLILAGIGFLLGGHMAAWVSSLEYTSVASSVVLVTSHPLLVSWLSSRYLGEETTRKGYLGIIVGLIGISIMAFSDYRISGWSLFGDLLAIIGMVLVSGYIIKGRQMRKKLSVVPYAFVVYGFSSAFLALVSLIVPETLRVYPAKEYLLFLALAIIPTIFGHTVYNWSLRYVKARVASISLLGEPIISSFLALIILNEVPPGLTIFGAGIALFGIYFCQKFG